MGLFDRLFGKKKDTEEVVEEQKNTQELDKKEAEETLDTTVAEPATEETVSEDVEQVAGKEAEKEATQEPSTSDESSETTSNEFSDVMADYYAKKEAAQAALDRGETVEFEAVETRKEVEEVSEPEAPASAPVETEEEKYNRSLKKTRTGFSARLNAFLANFRRVDEDFFEELEEMLILSDVGVNVATQLTEDLRYEAKLENAKKLTI